MTASARTLPQRRGACPGLSAPMPTGDGLLVRLLPIGTIPCAAFAGLCRAARAHGNGVIEITARGSIQVRGLDSSSAPRFAADVGALGIAAADGVPILSNALAGLDPDELLDAGALAADLRIASMRRSLAARLGAKVSVAIDGGGAISLDGLSADVRLCAEATHGGAVLRVSVGGDGASATQLGTVAPAHGVQAALLLLEVVSRQGRNARARDILAGEGIAVLHAALGDLFLSSARPRESGDPDLDSRLRGNERREGGGRFARDDSIGMHRLTDGSSACGIGVAFGHANATSLERLIEAAGDAGASGLRPAADRALMVIGLAKETCSFVAAAERLDFIVRADDPRRHVIACAGAPICASALIASRTIGPLVAATAAPLVDRPFKIHVSGCAKGCAHAAPAALTVVGTPGGCALIANGSARDAPFAVVPVDELPAAIVGAMANQAREAKRENGHG